MQVVPLSSLNGISGGQAKQLTVTQKISLDGISNACIAVLKDASASTKYIKNQDDIETFREILVLKLSNACSFKDILSFEDKSSPFLTVEYK
jgi:hypothetical protein